MLKKVLLIVGNIVLGLNFGLFSAVTPICLAINVAIASNQVGGDAISFKAWAVTSLVMSALTFIGTYIYTYIKKREHESPNVYGMCLAISFAIGALLMACILFIGMADPNSTFSQ